MRRYKCRHSSGLGTLPRLLIVACPVSLVVMMRAASALAKGDTASALDSGQVAKGRDVGAVAVFEPSADGQRLTLEANGAGFVDLEAGSVWNTLGQAISGPLTDAQLPAVHMTKASGSHGEHSIITQYDSAPIANIGPHRRGAASVGEFAAPIGRTVRSRIASRLRVVAASCRCQGVR